MISVLYVSTAKYRFTEEELTDLLSKPRVNNAQRNVTGMLLYKDLNFMQVVEGPEAAVDALMAKIATDSRHCGMVTLLRENVTERRFGDWSMGFIHPEDDGANRPAGFSEIMDAQDPSAFFRNPTLAQKVLAGFRDAL